MLIKLLDFKRPLTDTEKQGFIIRQPSDFELYPAMYSLRELGKKSLLGLLEAYRIASSERG